MAELLDIADAPTKYKSVMKRREHSLEKKDAKRPRPTETASHKKIKKSSSHLHVDERKKSKPVSTSKKEAKLENEGDDDSVGLFTDLCVSHIPDFIADEDLEDGLFVEFDRYGKVCVKAHKTNHSRVAYIRFTCADDAKKAYKSVNAHPLLLADRRVLVAPCTQHVETDASMYAENYLQKAKTHADFMSPPTRVLFVGNLEIGIDKDILERVFEMYGKIEDINIKYLRNIKIPKCYAFIKFSNITSAQMAKDALHNTIIGSRQCKIGFGDLRGNRNVFPKSEPSEKQPVPTTSTHQWRSIAINKIPDTFSPDSLRSILEKKFEGFGSMTINIDIKSPNQKIAYINFKYPSEAKAAYENNSDLSLDGHCVEIYPMSRHGAKPLSTDLGQKSKGDSNLEYDQVSNADDNMVENVSDVPEGKDVNSESRTDGSKKKKSKGDKKIIASKKKKKTEPKFKLDEKATSNLFVGNLPSGTTENELHTLFVKYGQIECIVMKTPPSNKSYAFVKYINIDFAQRAQVQMNGQMFNNHKLNISYTKSKVTSCLWVGGLGSWLDAGTFKKKLECFGEIKQFIWPKGFSFAHVQYEDDIAAQAACHTLHLYPMGGKDKRLRVDFISDQNIFIESDKRNKMDADDPEKAAIPVDEDINKDTEEEGISKTLICEKDTIIDSEERNKKEVNDSEKSGIVHDDEEENNDALERIDKQLDVKNLLVESEERNEKDTDDQENVESLGQGKIIGNSEEGMPQPLGVDCKKNIAVESEQSNEVDRENQEVNVEAGDECDINKSEEGLNQAVDFTSDNNTLIESEEWNTVDTFESKKSGAESDTDSNDTFILYDKETNKPLGADFVCDNIFNESEDTVDTDEEKKSGVGSDEDKNNDMSDEDINQLLVDFTHDKNTESEERNFFNESEETVDTDESKKSGVGSDEDKNNDMPDEGINKQLKVDVTSHKNILIESEETNKLAPDDTEKIGLEPDHKSDDQSDKGLEMNKSNTNDPEKSSLEPDNKENDQSDKGLEQMNTSDVNAEKDSGESINRDKNNDKSEGDFETVLENETVLSTSSISDKSFMSFVSSGSLSPSSSKKRKSGLCSRSVNSDISDNSFISFISSESLHSKITKKDSSVSDTESGIWAPFSPVHKPFEKESDKYARHRRDQRKYSLGRKDSRSPRFRRENYYYLKATRGIVSRDKKSHERERSASYGQHHAQSSYDSSSSESSLDYYRSRHRKSKYRYRSRSTSIDSFDYKHRRRLRSRSREISPAYSRYKEGTGRHGRGSSPAVNFSQSFSSQPPVFTGSQNALDFERSFQYDKVDTSVPPPLFPERSGQTAVKSYQSQTAVKSYQSQTAVKSYQSQPSGSASYGLTPPVSSFSNNGNISTGVLNHGNYNVRPPMFNNPPNFNRFPGTGNVSTSTSSSIINRSYGRTGNVSTSTPVINRPYCPPVINRVPTPARFVAKSGIQNRAGNFVLSHAIQRIMPPLNVPPPNPRVPPPTVQSPMTPQQNLPPRMVPPSTFTQTNYSNTRPWY